MFVEKNFVMKEKFSTNLADESILLYSDDVLQLAVSCYFL